MAGVNSQIYSGNFAFIDKILAEHPILYLTDCGILEP